MNSEELKKEFGLLMPSEINGFKRPDESISSSNDFFLEIPQLISKDPVLYSTMNLIFSVILSNDKLLKQWIDTLQNVVNAQDWRIVTDTLKGYMTPELKKKLDGIATGANNYVHPSSHPATMITQDATHRFVSDTEKNTWNAKASTAVVSTTANGLAPKRDGNANHFLAGDGTWKVVSSASSATSATKATQDSRGQQIDTTYIKGVTGSNATLTVTKGNGTTSTTTINNVANATNAKIVSNTAEDGSATDLVTGTMASNDYFRIRIGGSSDAGYAEIATADNGDEPIYVRQYGGLNFGFSDPVRTATILDESGNTSFPGTVTAPNFNGKATKATQDSQGQAINTTYIKGITASNATLTLTKGNGTTSTVTINNVDTANKAIADKNGLEIDTGYLKLSGGKITGFLSFSPTEAKKTIGIEYSTVANIFRVTSQGTGYYLNFLNADTATSQKDLICNFPTSPTAPTPSISDNSTNVATTAFVKTLFSANKNKNGWWKDTNTGFLYQWGSITASTESEIYYLYGEATFPLTFSTVFQAVVCHDGFTPTGSCVNGLSNSQIKVKLGIYGVTPQNTPWTCRYLAVGLA